MINDDKKQAILWKSAKKGVKEIAYVLCYRDSFAAEPHDDKRAKEVLDGEIYYRQRLIKISEWEKPSNIEAGLLSGWKFYYHSLAWLEPLRRHHRSIPDDRFTATYLQLITEWLSRYGIPPLPLPSQKAPGDYTWYDMATAWRTMVIIGALSMTEDNENYLRHLETHAEALSNEAYYAGIGNHALHQNYALLSAALVLNRNDYFQLALNRTQALRAISIDDEGVSLEGSVGYHLFNLDWWANMKHQLDVVDSLVDGAHNILIPDMRPFLRCAVAPDGKIVPLGDSTMSKGLYRNVVNEYPAEFVRYIESDPYLLYALTCGLEGEPAPETMRAFADGFWFSRANTKDRRAEQQSHASIRFGNGLATRVHAHDDAGSITFYPRGIRVLEDGGLFGYYGGAKREFVKSNLAHNVVAVEGRKYYRSAVSVLESSHSGQNFDVATVRITAIEKARWTRIVAHARDEDFLFIQDHVTGNGAPYKQLFNLGDGFEAVELREGRLDAQNGAGTKVSLIWLNEKTQLGLVRGKETPLMGWRSTFEGELHPVTCVTGIHSSAGEGITGKSALIVLLLDSDEDFTDISVSGVQYGSAHTKFILRRKQHESICHLAFNSQESQSALTRRGIK